MMQLPANATKEQMMELCRTDKTKFGGFSTEAKTSKAALKTFMEGKGVKFIQDKPSAAASSERSTPTAAKATASEASSKSKSKAPSKSDASSSLEKMLKEKTCAELDDLCEQRGLPRGYISAKKADKIKRLVQASSASTSTLTTDSTVPVLTQACKDHGIKGYSKLTKNDLIDLLRENNIVVRKVDNA